MAHQTCQNGTCAKMAHPRSVATRIDVLTRAADAAGDCTVTRPCVAYTGFWRAFSAVCQHTGHGRYTYRRSNTRFPHTVSGYQAHRPRPSHGILAGFPAGIARSRRATRAQHTADRSCAVPDVPAGTVGGPARRRCTVSPAGSGFSHAGMDYAIACSIPGTILKIVCDSGRR